MPKTQLKNVVVPNTPIEILDILKYTKHTVAYTRNAQKKLNVQFGKKVVSNSEEMRRGNDGSRGAELVLVN